jgi:hypothetical protein
VKKLTIWRVQRDEPPVPTIYAVPGHVLKLDERRRAVVCGDGRLLTLIEADVDGTSVEPRAAFATVRQRLGLDVQGHLAELARRLERLEQLERERAGRPEGGLG